MNFSGGSGLPRQRNDALRARIVLLRSEGRSEAEVAAMADVSVNTVSLWSQRFELTGMEGLADAAGRGRKPSLPESKIRQVVAQSHAAAGWSSALEHSKYGQCCGDLASECSHDLEEQRPKASPGAHIQDLWDPRFEEKFWDVIGLYLDPPDKALVLCCDEKSQCQALERTQPGLPLGIGHVRTKTHDYKRHGTITLFAALNYLDGKLISRTERRHTHVEWLRFSSTDRSGDTAWLGGACDCRQLRNPQARTGEDLAGKHPRFQMHFTPTSSSWLNSVERFFGEITADCIRDGSFQTFKNWSTRSWSTLPRATKTQNATSGKPRAQRFWRRSSEPNRLSNQLIQANCNTLH